MWPSSPRRESRGFTLTELLVTIAALVVVLTLSAQLLFATRRASDRQRLQTEPRQIARGAADYVNYIVRTASDLNNVLGARNPLGIMVWYRDGNNTAFQASYNNLTATQATSGLGDQGTDIITVTHADSAVFAPLIAWRGNQRAESAYWQFNQRCPDSTANLAAFKQLTGAHPGAGGVDVSDPIIIVDANGAAGTYQITDYKTGFNADNCSAKGSLPDDTTGATCAANQGCMAVAANPALTDRIDPYGGQPPGMSEPIRLHLGPRFIALRVRNRWLEQKFGLFNPNTDNPGSAFQRLLPNVEDFQVAWIFNNGETHNSTVANRLTTTSQVPAQGTTGAYDAINVAGMRVTFTTRSAVVIPGEINNRYLRPAAEDRVAATARDQFFRVQLSATSMIRNRWVGR
jgi:prepilin-type N-terminal cleavage/methylation domain-containing protein